MTIANDWRGFFRSPAFWIMGACALVMLFGVAPAHAADATSATGGSLPWDSPIATIRKDLSGPVAFGFALIIIFLVLAAQFESIRDPLVILISVPMAISGALVPLFFGVATINIYTQVGLLTLIGLISKHGILMVEFANELQLNENLNKRAAIEKAARVRLRPILMTTAAMVTGLLPLLTASGAGAASRFSIGLVVVSGMTIGTLFTLFVLPAVYVAIATDHQAELTSKRTKEIKAFELGRA